MRRRTCSSSRTTGRKMTAGTLFPALLDQFGDEPGPAGLVARADTGAVIPMEIFVEKKQVLPVGIALEQFRAASDGAAALLVTNENVNEAAGDFGRHFPEIYFASRSRREFHFEVLAVVMVVLLQGFDQEIVHREPDGAAPVGIAAKNAAGGFGGFVVYAVDVAIDLDFIGMIEVVARERANAIGRQKLGFVKHAAEDALQLFTIRERKQAANTARRTLRHFDVFRHVRVIVNKPLHAALEAGKAVDDFRLESLHGEKRNEANQRSNFQEMIIAIWQVKDVIIKAVFVVPESDAIRAHVIHGVGNVHEMLEKFAGYVLVGRIFFGQ